MKIISKIHVHPLYYMVAFLFVITGMFHTFVILNALIFFHELGHVIAGIYYHWKIEKILLLPFGGMTVFSESVNRPLKEEFIIACMGPCFQVLTFYILGMLGCMGIEKYHYTLLCFNLLPMIPLDGSKIIGCFFHFFFPFKKSEKMLFFLSIFVCFSLLLVSLYYRNLIFFILLLFLCKEIYKSYRLQPYLFYKFLLERTLSFLVFRKVCYIEGEDIKKMRKDYNHMFYIDCKWHSERQVLRKYFKQ